MGSLSGNLGRQLVPPIMKNLQGIVVSAGPKGQQVGKGGEKIGDGQEEGTIFE